MLNTEKLNIIPSKTSVFRWNEGSRITSSYVRSSSLSKAALCFARYLSLVSFLRSSNHEQFTTATPSITMCVIDTRCTRSKGGTMGHADVPYNDRASVLQEWGHSETLSHNKCLWPLDHYCCPNCINTSMHHNISCLPTCHHLWSNTGFAKFFSANVRKLKVVRKSRDFGLFHFQPGLNLATLLWSYDLLVGQKLVYY